MLLGEANERWDDEPLNVCAIGVGVETKVDVGITVGVAVLEKDAVGLPAGVLAGGMMLCPLLESNLKRERFRITSM